jgi:hypothetical protein
METHVAFPVSFLEYFRIVKEMMYLNVCECIICCDHYIATSGFIKHIIVTIFWTSSWKKKPTIVDIAPYHCLMCDITYKRSKQDLGDVFYTVRKIHESIRENSNLQECIFFNNKVLNFAQHTLVFFCIYGHYRVMHLHSMIRYFPHSKLRILQW